MFIDHNTRLHHMLDAAKEAVLFSANTNRTYLDTNRMLTLSLVKCIEIVGEAASRISTDRQKELPQIPWSYQFWLHQNDRGDGSA
ncbi:MAG: hypothetical protein WCD53_02705, partial [Microcoleus sp.]